MGGLGVGNIGRRAVGERDYVGGSLGGTFDGDHVWWR